MNRRVFSLVAIAAALVVAGFVPHQAKNDAVHIPVDLHVITHCVLFDQQVCCKFDGIEQTLVNGITRMRGGSH